MDYPKHLSQKIREDVAVSYLKHELRKIFPSIDSKEVENLMNNKELCTPRDFWNGLHGVGMGFKLHIGFIYLVTAENINWTRETLSIDELSFGADRINTKIIGSKRIIDIKEFYKKNPELMENDKNMFLEKWNDDEERERDTIIVNEKEDGLAVYEGHGRLEKAMWDGRETIEAFVGRYTSEIKKPQNYWIPTGVLMDVLYYAYEAIKNKDEKMFDNYIAILKDMLKNSESGKDEFLERALTNKKELREKILGTMKTI